MASSAFSLPRCFVSRPSLWLGLAVLLVQPAGAVPFNIGAVEANLDSQLSLQSRWAASAPNKDLIGTRNGGRAPTQTNDDGRLNFARGEAFSQRVIGEHGLELRQGDSGAFISGRYWYDWLQMDRSLPLYDLHDNGRQPGAKASGAEFLQAFAYHNYQLEDRAGDLRVGRQLLDWSAASLLNNPLNSITPLDRQALHSPATPLAEGALPVNLLHLGQQLTDSLSAEVFYQLEWRADVQDNCGSYLAASDVQAAGCDTRLALAGSDYQAQAANGYRYLPRQGDNDARDGGQYGLALHGVLESLGNSEVGLYALNYHSRAAYFSTQVGEGGYDPLTGASTAQYRMVYPEDVRSYGLSLAHQQGGTRLAAQLTYQPNAPLQLNSNDLTQAALDPLAAAGNPLLLAGYASSVPGSAISGYRRQALTQLQLVLSQVVEQVLAAEQLQLQVELGYDHLGGVADSALRYGRDAVYGSGQLADNSQCAALNPQGAQACNEHGFYSEHSWGYRARASLEYADVWPAVNLTPSLALAQDLSGYGAQFNQGSKAVGLGLGAVLQSTYSADLSYNSFFGGQYNPLRDRDFVALSLGLRF